MLEPRWPEAAAAWDALGCAWWGALCLGLSPDLDDARSGTARLAALGADASRVAVLRVRPEAGLAVPRGPRRRTQDNPAGLTAREMEVLALLAEGLTNAQLAERLFLSEKTVDHHVSSVLRKLAEPTRSGAVAAALHRGILPNMGSPPDVPSAP
jgi:DNA-binding CsgD family transcriptional regulator